MKTISFLFFRSINAVLISVLLLVIPVISYSQNTNKEKLAAYYFERNEFDKAIEYYENLFESNSSNSIYFSRYIQCLSELKDFNKAEKIVKKQIKKNPNFMQSYIVLGQLYLQNKESDKSEKAFKEGIKIAKGNINDAYILGNEFIKIGQLNYALETFIDTRKNLSQRDLFSREISRVYLLMNDKKNLIEENLDLLKYNPRKLVSIESDLQEFLTEKSDLELLQNQLLNRIQKDNQEMVYTEMLIWLYLEQKEFNLALNQIIALDKRSNAKGLKVYEFAFQCTREEEYETAIKAYEYILTINKSNESSAPFMEELLSARKNFITKNLYTVEQLQVLDKEYANYLIRFGKTENSARVMKDYANFMSLYLDRVNDGINLLNDVLQFKGIPMDFEAQCKMDLGDLYLLNNEIWEPTLLYGQVMSTFKDAPLGQLAKFKSCKLDYYRGDFELAKSELNVLKASTTQLIANDALELSLLIGDNTGLDSNETALKLFSRAELDVYQNKFDQAFLLFDSLQKQFPYHSLSDEILFQKAKIEYKKRNWQGAIDLYTKVFTEYGQDILADNSLFSAAEIYENKLLQKEKANELYEKIIIDFPGSIYVIEARKRFREIRGN